MAAKGSRESGVVARPHEGDPAGSVCLPRTSDVIMQRWQDPWIHATGRAWLVIEIHRDDRKSRREKPFNQPGATSNAEHDLRLEGVQGPADEAHGSDFRNQAAALQNPRLGGYPLTRPAVQRCKRVGVGVLKRSSHRPGHEAAEAPGFLKPVALCSPSSSFQEPWFPPLHRSQPWSAQEMHLVG